MPATTTIKRTKFKLTPEQLLDMFYWLKLIRAFDLRLSVLVKQGKVRSGVYTGIGQEAIIVAPASRCGRRTSSVRCTVTSARSS